MILVKLVYLQNTDIVQYDTRMSDVVFSVIQYLRNTNNRTIVIMASSVHLMLTQSISVVDLNITSLFHMASSVGRFERVIFY